jgi:hypothetical protein
MIEVGQAGIANSPGALSENMPPNATEVKFAACLPPW